MKLNFLPGKFPCFSISLILLFSCFSISASAQIAPNPGIESLPGKGTGCSEYFTRAGAFSYQRLLSADGLCFLNVDPFEINNFVYRSYLSSSNGTFMVFNSYSPKEGPGTTGARVFIFFPRQRPLEMKLLKDRSVLQLATPGFEIHYSLAQTQVIGMKGGKVSEAKTVSPSNQGGVEFSHVKTLYLDLGFTMDHDPSTEPARISRFTDHLGKTCDIVNRELFLASASGNTSFRFSDAELKTFLAQRCPNLEMNF